MTHVKKTLSIFTLAALLATGICPLAAQQSGQMVSSIEINHQLYPLAVLPNVTVISKREFGSTLEQARFNQLKRNVAVVYPYAVEAARIYHEMNLTLASTDKRRQEKKYINKMQNQLEDQFANSLKNLTVTQGEILVKLVSRYTGKTCYDLISDFKNPVSAFVWQNASKMYGYSLKTQYDPQQEKDLEMIVRAFENSYN